MAQGIGSTFEYTERHRLQVPGATGSSLGATAEPQPRSTHRGTAGAQQLLLNERGRMNKGSFLGKLVLGQEPEKISA